MCFSLVKAQIVNAMFESRETTGKTLILHSVIWEKYCHVLWSIFFLYGHISYMLITLHALLSIVNADPSIPEAVGDREASHLSDPGQQGKHRSYCTVST